MPKSELIRQVRTRAESRLSGLRTNRYSYWGHWRELAAFIMPRRYKWLITPNQVTRGSYVNQNIINSTGTLAARDLAGGLHSGLTNPMTPWFKFKIAGFEDENSNVNRWLAESTKRMLAVFEESNVYNSLVVLYNDLIIFATGAMLVYEDYENVICCHNPALGEFYLDVSPRLETNVFYREFVRTLAQLGEEFGVDALPESLGKMYKEGTGAELTREHIVRHAIEYNTDPTPLPKMFKWREVYWMPSSGNDEVLRIKGFHDYPCLTPRWGTVANDAYGSYCPGMDALGDIKQLQQEEKRKAQAIDKMVNPPMVADVAMKNQPQSGLPGGVTYVTGFGRDRPGFAPAYQVMPPVAEIKEDIAKIEDRIRRIFFNNLFTDISNLQTVRSAAEIQARREEKLLMLPTIKRLDKEVLAPLIERTWGIMMRGGLLPKPIPPEVVGSLITIKYTSPFAMAMLAAETTAIERVWQFAGNIAAVKPEVLDNLDEDGSVHIYGDDLGVDPRVMRKNDDRDAMRQQRAQQQQAEQAAQMGMAAAQGGKVLSETDVGGGQNALQKMLGNAA